ncbi:unnamed protein product, partial [Heterosigma akashiwo]
GGRPAGARPARRRRPAPALSADCSAGGCWGWHNSLGRVLEGGQLDDDRRHTGNNISRGRSEARDHQ